MSGDRANEQGTGTHLEHRTPQELPTSALPELVVILSLQLRQKDLEIEEHKKINSTLTVKNNELNERYLKLLEERDRLSKMVDELKADLEKVKEERKQDAIKLDILEEGRKQDATELNSLKVQVCNLTQATKVARANEESAQSDALQFDAIKTFCWAVECARRLISYRLGKRWVELMIMVAEGDKDTQAKIYEQAKKLFSMDNADWDLISRTLYGKRNRRIHETKVESEDEIIKLLEYLPDEFTPHLAKIRQFVCSLMKDPYFYDTA